MNFLEINIFKMLHILQIWHIPQKLYGLNYKKRVKDRNLKNLDELKIITIEEWIKIPKKFIQKLFKNFIKRCQKIIELKGGRLEPVHLN